MKKKWFLLILVVFMIAGLTIFYPFIKSDTREHLLGKQLHLLEKIKCLPSVEKTATNGDKLFGVPIEYKVQIPVINIVQETNYYCVPACVQMVLRLFNIDIDQKSLAEEMNTHPITGTEYENLAITINSYLFQKGLAPDNEPGYHIQTLDVNDQTSKIAADFERRVKEDIDTSYPVFAAINTQALYPELPESNHMILVTGYALHKNSDRVAFYYVMDPYTLVQDPINKGSKIFSSEELMQAMLKNEEPAYLW